METEKPDAADEDKEQTSLIASAQITSPEEDLKPQSSKEEETSSEKKEEKEVEEKIVEEKIVDEKMEVEPCPETAAPSEEKGKWRK